ncbi:hypothetical protein PC9H_000591 [Pleurotus ostreatus]|uniref:F-box domain-containing protein n=1 Tax=Pleurotus ostreatus TaxID=5322 RepID=A0A8H7A410_PLEOS|nr:uncharacterized protein PC9H_000591 [Pleurotus ostreatus]KAF7440247.1 hypothetical protein PC9H_000591 [Pleurotus ostreatus]
MSFQDAKERRPVRVMLPFELTHHIIAFLNDRSDRRNYQKVGFPALKACSLVCRAWNDICRHCIFHTVTADICISQERDSPLSFLHFTAPHLYRYVTDLILFWDRDVYGAPEWIPNTLPRFVNLRSLYLESRMTSGAPALPRPFALGVMALLDKAPLKCLSLTYWDFLADASDLLLLLSVCSTTLEELSLETCSVSDRGTMPNMIVSESRVPPIVCLQALRKIKLQGDSRAFQTSRIESPNLRSLVYEQIQNSFCTIPNWISDKLSEVSLKAFEVSDIPDLGQSICPSSMTVDISKSHDDSFFTILSWVKGCLQSLPFPHVLRQLNIKIKSNRLRESEECCYPTRADYELLYSTLEPLRQHGALHTNLSISILSLNHRAAIPADNTMNEEVAKLKEVFTPLLEANQLAIEIVLERWGGVAEPLHIICFASLPSPFSALQTLGITSLLAAGRIQSFEMESYDLIEDDFLFFRCAQLPLKRLSFVSASTDPCDIPTWET